MRRISAPMGEDEIAPGHVAVGRVLGVSGLRGELKVEPLAPEVVLAPGRVVKVAGAEYAIEGSRRSGRQLRLKLRDIDSREAAQGLRGAYLQTRESDLEGLPEGQYYRFQLIGLVVRSVDGQELGRVTDIVSALENDVYVVAGPLGEVLVPAVEDVVREVNFATKVITIEIIPGLLP